MLALTLINSNLAMLEFHASKKPITFNIILPKMSVYTKYFYVSVKNMSFLMILYW